VTHAGRRAVLLWAGGLAWGAGCADAPGQVQIRGAGATLPRPLVSHWIARYRAIAPRVAVSYHAVGSAGGVRQLRAGMAELAASDAPLLVPHDGLLQLPTTASAVALAHCLPGLEAPLRLGPRALAAIYLGRALRWNDGEIARDNPGVTLPDLAVVPVHRSDGSGATALFTAWLARRGATGGALHPGMHARFPVGLGARGSDGVAGMVRRVAGAVGYVEVVHARAAGLEVAAIASNDADPGTLPDAANIARALDAATAGDDLTSLLEVGPRVGYPLTSFTWVVTRRAMDDVPRATALAHFLWWVLGPGQDDCAALGYHPLSPELRVRARAVLVQELRVAGRAALQID